ncbi:hypothetical protein IWW48_005235 [Coemansia sp. RSA 1200]|nr:hypothetical protein IWW48_005235 [Coemansia sp. RSA 1200]
MVNVRDSDATPLTHPDEFNPNDLMDTPEFKSSWLHRLFFSWSNHLFSEGIRRRLQYSDIYKVDQMDNTVPNWRRYQHYRKPGRSLFATMAMTFAPELLTQVTLALIKAVGQFSGPFFLGRIIRAVELSNNGLVLSNPNIRRAYFDAFALFFCTLISSLLENYARWVGNHMGVRFKGILVAELSTKTLSRSKNSSSNNKRGSNLKDNTGSSGSQDDISSTDGKIMNLMTADFERLAKLSIYLDQMYSYSLTLAIGIWYMYQLLGVSALVGLSLTAIYIPLSKVMYIKLTHLQKMVNVVSDKRISMVTELFQGIKAVKLFGWEAQFLKIVGNQRNNQLSYLWRIAVLRLYIKVVYSAGPMLILITMFSAHVAVLGRELTAEIAFTTLSVYQLLRFVFEHFPSYVTWSINGYVSLGRIETYLGQPQVQALEERVVDESVNTLGFEAADLEWESTDRSWMDAGLAGFVLSYALSFSHSMIWVVLNYSYNEVNMNAVERIMQYMDIDQEAPLESDSANKPAATWPNRGDVQIENLVVEYVPGVPVLHGISLSVEHGKKIGVVGRTGAGKSTISLALLRFIEASKGQIVLDGVDISKIGLEDLRRNVTIIPQDPVLFNGTIRFNLDPFGEHPDELLWDALSRTHLLRSSGMHDGDLGSSAIKDTENDESNGMVLDRMAGIFTSLDAEIKENGQNLSLGQRQLVALARALVRRSKLIIMDEATASVDFDTDNRIQKTIRGPEFANSTLFCIAHRLRTIIDYDKVLVLDHGKVVEFDTPYNLLQNENGIFRHMCEKSGEYKHLIKLASSHR